MLIGARTGAWSGGAKLPYDAEVEWLSAIGNAYINTGFSTEAEPLRMTAEVLLTGQVSQNAYPIGSEGSTNQRFAISTISVRRFELGLGAASTLKFTCTFNEKYTAIVDGIGKVVSIGGQSGTSAYSGQNSDFIGIFRRGYASGFHHTTNPYLRVFSFKLESAAKTLFDGVPVRKGDVGGMYDMVSKKVFWNAEDTGSFRVGPDK